METEVMSWGIWLGDCPYLLGKPIEWKQHIRLGIGCPVVQSLLVRETNWMETEVMSWGIWLGDCPYLLGKPIEWKLMDSFGA